jgi:hypothetical protein
MNAFCRAGLAIVSLLMALATSALGQDLRLSSIRIVESNIIELSLTDPPTTPVRVQASMDFGSWADVTNATPDSRGVLAVTDPALGAAQTFFRVGKDGPLSDRFVGTVNADYAGAITNATVTVVATGKTFTTDQNGRVSIPVSELEFETGFRLKVESPGFVSETIDLPPGLYAYTFSLTPVALAPATVVGRTYSLGESNTITLYDTGMFRLETTNGVSSGGYFVERSTTIADTWSIKTASPTGYLGIGLTFSSETAGRFTNVVVASCPAGEFENSSVCDAGHAGWPGIGFYADADGRRDGDVRIVGNFFRTWHVRIYARGGSHDVADGLDG